MLMLPNAALARFHTPEFLRFLDETAGVSDDDGYLVAMNKRNLRYAVASITAAYHELARLFDACPGLVSVRPVFEPELDVPNKKHVFLRVHLALQTTNPDEDPDYAEEYGHGQYPEDFDDAARAACDAALQACRNIGLEAWDEIHAARLFHKKEGDPWTSPAQMEGDLMADVGEFPAQVAQWHLEHALPEPSAATPGPRL